MTRIRITTTNDATAPKILSFGNGIRWLVYLRSPDTLCVQREVNEIRDTEVQVTSPVLRFDAVEDPADPTSGWVYFVHDGVLERMQVTPLTVVWTAVAYTRTDGWTSSLPGLQHGTGLVRSFVTVDHPPIKTTKTDQWDGTSGATGLGRSWTAQEGPDAPTIALERITGAPQLDLVLTLPNRTLFRNRNITQLRIYRKETEALGYIQYGVEPVGPAPETWEPPQPAIRIQVPFTSTPITYWRASCVRTGYLANEGLMSTAVWDDGTYPLAFHVEQFVGLSGNGLMSSWLTTEHPPIKKNLTPDLWQNGNQSNGGTGLIRSWLVNGSDILHP